MKNKRFILLIIFILAFFSTCNDPDNTNTDETSPISTFNISFQANGGSPAPSNQVYEHGSKVSEPTVMTRSGYSFLGWYKDIEFLNKWSFYVDIVTEDTILYAKWVEAFVVTFEANGGNIEVTQKLIVNGYIISELPQINKEGFSFEGWYKEAEYINAWDFDNDVVAGNIVLYAKWGPPIYVPGASFGAKMRWLDSNIKSGGFYIVEVDSNQSISQKIFSYNEKYNYTINIKGIGIEPIVISLSENGSIFIVENSATIILEGNLEFQGKSNNTSLIQVKSNSKLILNDGIIISGNVSAYGGGIYVGVNGNLIMNGGVISGNSAFYGGGVYVDTNGCFTLNGGVISNNTVSSNGGGVYIADGTFNMSGGSIRGNTSSIERPSNLNISQSYSISSCGGGVYIAKGTFNMSGGSIFSNYSKTDHPSSMSSSNSYSISSNGGGVYVAEGIFSFTGGSISYNASISPFLPSFFNGSYSKGGGVYIDTNGTFTMSDGTILNNSVSSNVGYSSSTNENHSSYGGGIYINGKFTMKSGEIYNNTSIDYSNNYFDPKRLPQINTKSYGGGIFIANDGVFIMDNGKIYNNDTSSAYSYGGGVYIMGSFTFNNGEIFNNSSESGGGIYIDNGIFSMNLGNISSNTANNGGGVYIASNNIITMNNGNIIGNTALNNGGGVYISDTGTFNMINGKIIGNVSSSYGGGVYIDRSVIFKTGGIIYGYILENNDSNTVIGISDKIYQNRGHAIHANHSNTIYIMGKDSTSEHNNNFSFNGKTNPPVYSGDWDY